MFECQVIAIRQRVRLCSWGISPTGSEESLQLPGRLSHRRLSTSTPFLGGSAGRLRAQDEDKSYKVREGASGGHTSTTSQERH